MSHSQEQVKKLSLCRDQVKRLFYHIIYGANNKTICENFNLKESQLIKIKKLIFNHENKLKIYKQGEYIYNPITKQTYYKGKNELATLCQSTSSFIFHRIIYKLIKEGIIPKLTQHDEAIFEQQVGDSNILYLKIKNFIHETKKELNIKNDIKFKFKHGNSLGNMYEHN